MALRFDDLRSRDGDTIDRDYLNRRWKLIAENIRANSDRMDGFAATESQLVELGLQRIDDVLGPALQAVNSAVELGFLVQPSDTAVEMEVGIDVEFTLSETAAKDIFAPTPFLVVMDADDEDSWAIVKRLSYNKATGVLGVRPLYISGTGAGASWTIAASAGALPAMEASLADTLAAKNLAVAAAASATADKNTVASDKATVLTYRNQAEAAAAAAAADAAAVAEDSATIAQLITVLDDGPVLTVNGRVGAVTLDKTDVGLSNVDNTSDSNKPISSATQSALDAKQASLVSGTNIKTINGQSILGSGDLSAKADFYDYSERGALRSINGPDEAQAIVGGLGLFVFHLGTDEPDDDESCFATTDGRWLLEAPHWDVISSWNFPDDQVRDEWDAGEAARFAAKVLTGSANCAITSVAASSSASFTGTVTGAAAGDRVITNPPSQLGDTSANTGRLSFHAWVSAPDTVTVMLTNASAASAATNTIIRTAWPITVIKS